MALDRARGAALSTPPAPFGCLWRVTGHDPLYILALFSPGPPALPGLLLRPSRWRCPARPRMPSPWPDRPVAEIVAPRWSSEAESATGPASSRPWLKGVGIASGETVADIGAGSGDHAVPAQLHGVGPGGRGAGRGRHHLEPGGAGEARGRPRQRHRRPGRASLSCAGPRPPWMPAILVHMYHEITQPFGLLYNLAPRDAARRPGWASSMWTIVPSRHGTPPALLRCDEPHGRRLRKTGFHPVKAGAYLAVFAAPGPGRGYRRRRRSGPAGRRDDAAVARSSVAAQPGTALRLGSGALGPDRPVRRRALQRSGSTAAVPSSCFLSPRS